MQNIRRLKIGIEMLLTVQRGRVVPRGDRETSVGNREWGRGNGAADWAHRVVLGSGDPPRYPFLCVLSWPLCRGHLHHR